MLNFVAQYSKQNVFSEDLIVTARKNDNMLYYLEEICKAISATIPNIKYINYNIVDERTKYPTNFVELYDSIVYCVEFNFTITVGETSAHSKMILKIPKLIDNYYYYINGNRFYPIYQLTEATTFHKDESVVLKTLLSPIVLTRNQVTITDINGNEYPAYIIKLNMIKHKINFLLFFFSTIGFFNTLKFFEGYVENLDGIFYIVSADKVNPASKDYIYFEINKKIYLRVYAKLFDNNNIKTFTACILDLCKKRIRINEIRDKEYWKMILSKVFVKGNSINKAKPEMIIESFKRLYDNITKENIRKFEGEKDNIYEVLRWLFSNFTKLLYRDNNNIYFKRVRLSEYQMAPIIRKINTKIYRILNSRDSAKDIKKYEEILTLPYPYSPDGKIKKGDRRPSTVLIKSIINNNNTKYIDAVNDLDLFNIALKWTINGPSTTVGKSQKGNALAITQRSQSPSFIGKISLNTASAGDPGGTGVFLPFVKLKDDKFQP